MNEITIKNVITENEIVVNFDLKNGQVPMPPINISITGDIDLNKLINEIAKLIELKREFLIEFEDADNLADSNSKINLIKEILEGIYLKFNENIQKLLEEQATL